MGAEIGCAVSGPREFSILLDGRCLNEWVGSRFRGLVGSRPGAGGRGPVSRPTPLWKRRLVSLLSADPTGRTGFTRSALLPFFPSAFRGTLMVKCPGCGSENPARSTRCRRCRVLLPVTASRKGASLPFWLVGILVTVVASAAFLLGLETGRQSVPLSQPRSLPLPSPTATRPVQLPAIDPVASAAGLTWAIYTSQDRLTDRPILGARFGTAAGTPLFTILCAEGQAALSLKRGLLPAAEGASGNSKSTLDTIRVGVRIGERERERVELRFEDAAPEALDAIPRKPLEFLARVAASRRIRTANDDFDPTSWGEAIKRVTSECRFEARVETPVKRAKANR